MKRTDIYQNYKFHQNASRNSWIILHTDRPTHQNTNILRTQSYKGEDIYTVRRTFSFHSHCQTFLIAAVLAAITLALVHNAVLLITTSILQLLAHCALEKAFAAFAAATRQAIRHYSAELQYSAVEAKPTVFSWVRCYANFQLNLHL